MIRIRHWAALAAASCLLAAPLSAEPAKQLQSNVANALMRLGLIVPASTKLDGPKVAELELVLSQGESGQAVKIGEVRRILAAE